MPFPPSSVGKRGRAAFKDAKVPQFSLRECPHTFASLLIAAVVNPKAIQTFMGHATIQMTFDQHGHPMPWSRDEARETVDAYLAPRAPVASAAEQFTVADAKGRPVANPRC